MAPECPISAGGIDYCAHGPRHCGPCVPVCLVCGGSNWEGRATYYVDECTCQEDPE